MIKADLHTHTHYSHAADSVNDMASAAKKSGLEIFGFSEHSPRPAGFAYDSDYQEKLSAGYPRYMSEVQTLCRSGYSGMKILLGLEIDYIPQQTDFMRNIIGAYEYDYIIGGLHFQDGWGFDSFQAEWDMLGRERRFAVYTRYYEDLAALSGSGLVHIVAHPDLIKIFSVDSFWEWLKTQGAQSVLRQAFGLMRQYGVIMEVSSAGLRKPCKEIYPGPAIMELAAELGLKICISSDAHCTGHVAYAFDTLEEYARSFGYTESYIVEKKQPVALPFS